MIELNWRFAALMAGIVIVIIQLIVMRREMYVFDLIKALIKENTLTNNKLNDTLKEHSESTKEQGKQLLGFEREMTKEIAKLQGAVAKK